MMRRSDSIQLMDELSSIEFNDIKLNRVRD